MKLKSIIFILLSVIVASCVGRNSDYRKPRYQDDGEYYEEYDYSASYQSDRRRLDYHSRSNDDNRPAYNKFAGETPTVALVVPLTGAAQKAGKSILDAAKLALYDLGQSIELVAIDTKSSRVGAVQAAQRAVDSEANLILGPLYSNAVPQMRSVTEPAGINMVTFSNNSDVAGRGVYLLGIPPEQQLYAMIRYAAEAGITNISGLLPEDKFGEVARRMLNRAQDEGLIEIGAIETYSNVNPVFSEKVKKLSKKIARGAKTGKNGLLFPEGGARLAKAKAVLDHFGMGKKFTLLGSYLWDNQEIGQIKGLSGSWFISTPKDRRDEFNRNFEKQYGYQPTNLASLGYDAVALTISMASQGGFSDYAITDASGFVGINGFFRFERNGMAVRRFSIYRVGSGSTAKIDDVDYGVASSYAAGREDQYGGSAYSDAGGLHEDSYRRHR